jgi:hypothetical protein
MREAANIDAIDRAIIDTLQGGFPICERPYAEVPGAGHQRGGTARTPAANARPRVLTRFGPMFQVERMGGAFVLAAMRVPEADWQRVLEIVNAFPAVAHNYRRESDRNCEFNMWFVLATETPTASRPRYAEIEEPAVCRSSASRSCRNISSR